MQKINSNLDLSSHQQPFRQMLGSGQVVCGSEMSEMLHYGLDRSQGFTARPGFILFPRSTPDVQKIVAYCFEHNLPIVPSGGRTGYAAGAVAANNEIVLSMEKMNKMLFLDDVFGITTVQAGIITDELNNQLKEHNLYFPMFFAATGSTHIGGNIAANAGGVRVVRYGSLKNWILGLTIVDGKGQKHDLGGQFLKDAGLFDLKSLLIGSEGTLGVITEAHLRLTKQPGQNLVYLMALSSYEDVLQLYRVARNLPLNLNAFEFFTRICVEKVCHFISDLADPFAEKYPYYILMEVEGCQAIQCGKKNMMEVFIQDLLDKSVIQDGTTAFNSRQAATLWRYRETISEALTLYNSVHKNDISIPMHHIKEFARKLELGIENKFGHIEVAIFGHLGDGNIHVNFIKPDQCSEDQFRGRMKEVDDFVYGLVTQYHGSIAAEHGIGLLKKQALVQHSGKWEMHIMRQIKKMFDPKNILNPGKVLDI